jgi:hypothetical protein
VIAPLPDPDEHPRRPGAARQRATHSQAVDTLTFMAAAAALKLSPRSSTKRTSSRRPRAVSLALGWYIRVLPMRS